jgi:hypothetical protein
MKYETSKTEDFTGVISECYHKDNELISKFHVLAPTDTQSAIYHTVQAFKNTKLLGGFTMYKILSGGKLVAYFGCDTQGDLCTLSGFFIMPECRNKEFIAKFWRIVKSKMPQTFFCALYQKNKRGISFLKKKGFSYFGTVLIEKEDQFSDIYKFN